MDLQQDLNSGAPSQNAAALSDIRFLRPDGASSTGLGMNKKTIRDVDLTGKKVLMRVDFNVPVKDDKVTDATRILGTIPTIEYILGRGASIVMMSHRGQPKKPGYDAAFSLKPAAERLAEELKRPVGFAKDCTGSETKAMVDAMKPGDLLLLENTRFYAEEEGKVKMPEGTPEEEVKAAKAEMKKRQKEFAAQLAQFGDVYVNDAFGSAHRAHASTAIVDEFFTDRLAGFLMEKEIDYLGRVLTNPERPFVAILGGAKVSDKINVIENLMTKADTILIGGAMAYTFYRAMGYSTGGSLVEEDRIDVAKAVLEKAKTAGVKFLLPVDNIVAKAISDDAETMTVADTGIGADWKALDIGPKTAEMYAAEIARAKTVFWNGPMGVFETAKFAAGTLAVANAVAECDGMTVVGGGDSVAAVNQMKVADRISHISTGGGASLEFIEGKTLPGVAALSDK